MVLTIHHLQVSQSERVVWLCEELGIDYDLKLHQRDPIFSPPALKELHPLGAAPVIQDGPVLLAETGACFEWIIRKHGNGRLYPAPDHPQYADFLYWYHFGNGSLQPSMSRVMALRASGADKEAPIYKAFDGRFNGVLKFLDDHLATSKWMAGDEFTAADCMALFTPTTMRAFFPFDLSPYPNILSWIQRCVARPAYKRYRDMADPNIPDMTQAAAPKHFMEWSK